MTLLLIRLSFEFMEQRDGISFLSMAYNKLASNYVLHDFSRLTMTAFGKPASCFRRVHASLFQKLECLFSEKLFGSFPFISLWEFSIYLCPSNKIISQKIQSVYGLLIKKLFDWKHESDHWTNRSSEGSVPTFVCPYSICSPRPFEPKEDETVRTRFNVVTVNRMVGLLVLSLDGWKL